MQGTITYTPKMIETLIARDMADQGLVVADVLKPFSPQITERRLHRMSTTTTQTFTGYRVTFETVQPKRDQSGEHGNFSGY